MFKGLKQHLEIKKLKDDLKMHKDANDEALNLVSKQEKKISHMGDMCYKIIDIASSLKEEQRAQIITLARFAINYSKDMDQFCTPPEDIENCYVIDERGIHDCRRWRGRPNCSVSEECPRRKRNQG